MDVLNTNDFSNINQVKNLDQLSELEKVLNSKTFSDFKDRSEKLYIEKKLKENNFNISKTANQIKIQRSHVYNKINLFNIQLPEIGTDERNNRKPEKAAISN